VQVVGLLFAIPMGIASIAGVYKAIAPAPDVTAKQLASTHPPTRERVVVACDAIHDLGWQVLDGDEVTEEIVFCQMGNHLLPVVSRRGESPTVAGTVEGELRFIPDQSDLTTQNHPWVDALRGDAELDGRSFDVYLKRDSSDRRFNAVFGAVMTLAIGIGWFFWIRGFMRRRRAKKAPRQLRLKTHPRQWQRAVTRHRRACTREPRRHLLCRLPGGIEGVASR
jgi:hypothetical protein